MFRNPTVTEVTAACDSRPRWQILLLGLAIALLFYGVLALIMSAPQPSPGGRTGESEILESFSWGGTDPGQTQYRLTISADRSIELVWGNAEVVAPGATDSGAWLNSRIGSLCLNCK